MSTAAFADIAHMRRGAPAWPPCFIDLAERKVEPGELWWQGTLPRPNQPTVAIVGARRASASGIATAQLMARELAAAGVTVISGLARGIDTAAHQGALRGGGATIGVAGCGLDIEYPRGQKAMRTQMLASGGALLSEFAPGVEPRPRNFPQRNRIIAALADVVVVVEAAETSGALSTARWARDFQRDMLAVPGPITSPLSRGSNLLLRDGVGPYLEPADVLCAVEMAAARKGSQWGSTVAEPILDVINGGPTHLDEIATALSLPLNEVAARVSRLELDGQVRVVAGGLVERRSACKGGPGV